jgi:hypothetical protein
MGLPFPAATARARARSVSCAEGVGTKRRVPFCPLLPLLLLLLLLLLLPWLLVALWWGCGGWGLAQSSRGRGPVPSQKGPATSTKSWFWCSYLVGVSGACVCAYIYSCALEHAAYLFCIRQRWKPHTHTQNQNQPPNPQPLPPLPSPPPSPSRAPSRPCHPPPATTPWAPPAGVGASPAPCRSGVGVVAWFCFFGGAGEEGVRMCVCVCLWCCGLR